MKVAVDTIATHTATGAGTSHALWADGDKKQGSIADGQRLLQISGTFSATIKLEVSLDGTNWNDLETDITTAVARVIPDAWPYLRSNCTAFTSGSAVVKVSKLLED